MPTSSAPMLCRSADRLPEGAAWVYEPKFDGFRAILTRDGTDVALRGRNGGRLARSFPEIVDMALTVLPERCVVDGEIVALTADGLAFDVLLHRLGRADAGGPAQITFVAFDLLEIDGNDFRAQPLEGRRQALERCVRTDPRLMVAPQTDDLAVAQRWLDEFVDQGFEGVGVVAKRATQPYRSGKRDWVKVKPIRTADVVVGGYLGERGSPERLIVGLYRDGELRHVGQTNALDDRDRAVAAEVLVGAEESPFLGRQPGLSRWDHWRFERDDWTPVEPAVVVEVRYTALSHGAMRHAATFLRWRPDRRGEDCVADQLAPGDQVRSS
jgi:ATP-dependent DNA ligase